MKKIRIILMDPLFTEVLREFRSDRIEFAFAKNHKALARFISTADALITPVNFRVNSDLIARGRSLKAIGNVAVGVDNIDLKACKKRGIAVIHTPHVLTRSVAELTLALLFAAARRFPEGEVLCRKNRFKGFDLRLLLGLELKGRRAVIVGKGEIGRETAKLFRSVGIRVDFIRKGESEARARRLLKQAQILSLHIPLTPANHHWLNNRKIRLLPQDCIVLNTSRGPIIDERALIRALRARKIYAAGLDVFENEPLIPNQLRGLKNAVLLPHLGSATVTARHAMARSALAGVIKTLLGRRVSNRYT